MGQELECTMRYQRRSLAGRAYLETDFLLFWGGERLKVLFRDMTAVTAVDGVLRLEFAGGPAEFELGPAAAKWAGKILHPPSRMDKLGVKPGLLVRIVGEVEEAFRSELAGREAELAPGKAKVDLVFFAAATSSQLERVAKLAEGMKPEGAVWVIFPKGASAIREIEVLLAGRAGGLKDVKVASFSTSHTALKFVVPRSARPPR